MNPPPLAIAAETAGIAGGRAAHGPPVPRYLQSVYWWAYVHPKAVRVFEREWLVNAILFGNYRRLCDSALNALGDTACGRVLQVACVYGDLTERLRQRLSCDARLDVVDVLPIQLHNLARKLPVDPRVNLIRGDSAALPCPDAHYDQVLLFFLLHEQPATVRRATLAQALRVVKPGGKVIVVDYHRPSRWHPLRPLMRFVFRKLEPYAIDLWRHEVADLLPPGIRIGSLLKRTLFAGLYQQITLTRA